LCKEGRAKIGQDWQRMPPPLVHIIAGSGPADAGQKVLPVQIRVQSRDAAVRVVTGGWTWWGRRAGSCCCARSATQRQQSQQPPRAAKQQRGG